MLMDDILLSILGRVTPCMASWPIVTCSCVPDLVLGVSVLSFLALSVLIRRIRQVESCLATSFVHQRRTISSCC